MGNNELVIPTIALEGCHGVGKSTLWPHLNRELSLNYTGLDRCFLSVWAFSQLFDRQPVDLLGSAEAYFGNSRACLVYLDGPGLPDKPHPAAKQGVPYDNSELRYLLDCGLDKLLPKFSSRVLVLKSKSKPPASLASAIAKFAKAAQPAATNSGTLVGTFATNWRQHVLQ